MTVDEITQALGDRGCSLLEDSGKFVLVHPTGPYGGKAAHDLTSRTRHAALDEAWSWLHPEATVRRRIQVVQRVIAESFAVSPAEMCLPARHVPLSTARHIAMALARELTGASFVCIGSMFARDHATVIYAGNSVRDRVELDREFAVRVAVLRAACSTAIARA